MPEHNAPTAAQMLPLMTKAAHEAGKIALRYWRNAPEAWEKDDGAGPVSEADLAVDRHLQSLLMGAHPDYGWLSEETPDSASRLAHQRVFILDPIDGTRAYLAGDEDFAVSLALAQEGRIIAALVHLPARGVTYSATETGPALKNGQAISASARRDLTGADVLVTRANMEPSYWPQGVPQMKSGFRSSLALRLCLAAEGRYDAMLTFRDTWEWDSAAGSLIALRAGCLVTDQYGQALRFNQPRPLSPGLFAAPPPLHKELMAARLA